RDQCAPAQPAEPTVFQRGRVVANRYEAHARRLQQALMSWCPPSGSAGLWQATTSATYVLQNSTSPRLYLRKYLDKPSGKAVQAVQVDHPLPQIVPHGDTLCWAQRQQGD